RTRERPGEDRRYGDRVQDAERDPRARERHETRGADRRRACGDHRDPTPALRARRTLQAGERERDARGDEERCHDGRARGEPEGIVLEVEAGDAEQREIEREVVDDHRDDRQAAQRIERGDALRRGHARGGSRTSRAHYRRPETQRRWTAPRPSTGPSWPSTRATASSARSRGTSDASSVTPPVESVIV